MATYDETVGSAAIPWNQMAGNLFTLSKRLNVVAAVARHAVPTAAGLFKYSPADILQMIDFPAGCHFVWSHFETIVAGSAGTVDLGIAGGQEFDAAVATNASAGTMVVANVATAQGTIAAAADTADAEVLTADMAAADLGDYRWTLFGLYYP